MKRIETWLNFFTKYWKNYQIENVMTLFSNNVDYWETTFEKIKNKTLLEKEWQIIKTHKNIEIDYEIFSKSGENYTIIWEYKYLDSQGEKKHFRGTYLISLDIEGKCNYFLKCSEASII